MLISVVLSFRNEAENLPELIRRQAAVFAALDMPYELVFVNDASTDNSLEILLKARESNPAIRILNMSRRFGNIPCVLAGFAKSKGDAIIYMDTDLQDPPELIPQLIEKWREGADVVHTTRTARKGENEFKMWLTRKAYKIINRLSDITILENTGEYKLISRRAMDQILKLKEFDPYMRGLVAWVGFKQVQVFYERDVRFAGETKYSLWRSLNPYKEFIRGITRFSDLPLYAALIAGFFVSFVSVMFLAYTVLAFLLGRACNQLNLILGVLLFLGGSVLFTIGVLGIYIGVIHKEIKRRPRYIIQDEIG